MTETPQDPIDSSRAFELLHPRVQEELYAMGWTELRPIQTQAIHEIFTGSDHLVISAKTASGKTEAAFLPIISRVLEPHGPGVQALYMGPLKALINDQFRRLEELCRRTDLPVHKWHGDVGQSSKKKLMDGPDGIVLITPESTESLFVNKPQWLDKLFSGLQYIVIDEAHTFMGSERGAHLKSLLHRLNRKSRNPVRLLGLSATLGDIDLAGRWLCFNEKERYKVILDAHEDKTVKYRIHGYRIPGKEHGSEGPDLSPVETGMVDDLYQTFKGKTALIFGNSKAKLEFYADQVLRKANQAGQGQLFDIHHGSLSRNLREEVEGNLRSEGALAVFCSSTLEMGIDVGNVSLVGQLGAPWSVNSLVQRLGRSGRKDEQPSVMRIYIDQPEADEESSLLDRLYLDLLEAVAMSELMLEGWSEPPELDRRHFSALVHQILSLIAERGGCPADLLFDQLVTKGSFRKVNRKSFVRVLRSLGEKDLIEQTSQGDLILGLDGEKRVRSFDFYSLFKTSEEYKVTCKGAPIGTVGLSPSLGEGALFILAGRQWKILNLDEEKREILVEQARGGRLPYFPGRGGSVVHPRVRRKMKEMLFQDRMPDYLDEEAQAMLLHAREEAATLDLQENAIIGRESRLTWLTWTGSRINRTLWVYGRLFGKLKVEDVGVGLTFADTTADHVKETYEKIMQNPPGPAAVARRGAFKAMEKYDVWLSEDLQSEIFVHNHLDLKSATIYWQNAMGDLS